MATWHVDVFAVTFVDKCLGVTFHVTSGGAVRRSRLIVAECLLATDAVRVLKARRLNNNNVSYVHATCIQTDSVHTVKQVSQTSDDE